MTKVISERRDHKAPQGYRGQQVQPVRKVLLGRKVQLAHKAQRVTKAISEGRGHKDRQDHKGHRVQRVRQVPLALLARKGHRGHRDCQGHRV